MENKPKIIVRRKGEWMNRLKSYKVSIDGNIAGSVSNGNAEEFAVEPGLHKIRCKVNWCGSEELSIDLREGEKAYLEVKSGMKYYYVLAIPVLAVILYKLYLKIAGIKAPDYIYYAILVLAIPVFAYLIYYLTAGRNKYLSLGKDSGGLFAVK
ncbi:MAG TPA: hypothetical protein VLJ68_00245 [Chitinophagaceae bacterium]|nr:hypothetical protein [Chitinophagaceae bacterium]